MAGDFSFDCREDDYATLGDKELLALYEERRRRLGDLGAEVPETDDPVLDPAPLWLRVAFLGNVIRYEEERGPR